MNHAYLSKTEVNEALAKHNITSMEAEKLIKKIDCQVKIYNQTHK